MEKPKIKPLSGEVTRDEKRKAFEDYITLHPAVFSAQFERQGDWSPHEGVRVRMWKHKPTEHVLYEDHPLVRGRGLPIMKEEWTRG
jgi:hypothetical protein